MTMPSNGPSSPILNSPDNTIAENLAQIGRRRESVWRVRQVVAVTPPQVRIDVGGGASMPVPCLASYVNRSAGDKVLMVVTDVGWCVLGEIGGEDGSAATWTVPDPVVPDEPASIPPETVLAPDPQPDPSDGGSPNA